MSTRIRLLAAECAINGASLAWREDAPSWEWVLFDDVSSLVDWLDFQSYASSESGPRVTRVTTRGHVVLPADLAGCSGDYLAPDVLASGQWSWHAPRVFETRSRPVRPLLRVVK